MDKSTLMAMKMLAEDKAPSKEEFLQEGIKYGKTSKKLEKAIAKAEAAFEAKKGTLSKEDAKRVSGIIKRLNMAKVEFTRVEETYSTGAGKDIAMKKYKLLRTKYADIFKGTEGMKKVLVGAGIFSVLGLAALTLAWSIVPQADNSPLSSLESHRREEGNVQSSLEKSRSDFGTSGNAGENNEILKNLHKVSIGTDGILKSISKFFGDVVDSVKSATAPKPKKLPIDVGSLGGGSTGKSGKWPIDVGPLGD